MIKKSINEIESVYDLELDRIVKTIKKQKAKKILLQFPEAMKRYSNEISNEISERAKVECFTYLGTCFGACDIPMDVERLGIDLLIQFGHSSWEYKNIKGLKVVK
ncbi:hypothetical protein GOV12_01710 [Candidatus Pacearchaeota archaeon]|nr:hypothetical protein [Candidatus Pacearchaeota archaeon]